MKIKPTELTKLREYFDTNGITYHLIAWENNRYNIHFKKEWDSALSFLTSEGSYGGNQGLIEVYNFRDEPTGYLTAEDSIRIYEEVVSP